MRHERDDSMSRAAWEVRRRVRCLDEYHAAREAVVREAVERTAGCDVAAMRALGGFTAVIRAAIEAQPEWVHRDRGSELLGASIAIELRFEANDLVNEVKRRHMAVAS